MHRQVPKLIHTPFPEDEKSHLTRSMQALDLSTDKKSDIKRTQDPARAGSSPPKFSSSDLFLIQENDSYTNSFAHSCSSQPGNAQDLLSKYPHIPPPPGISRVRPLVNVILPDKQASRSICESCQSFPVEMRAITHRLSSREQLYSLFLSNMYIRSRI